jgi:L-asparaginase
MKKILLIATGGTIASKWTAEGLSPQLSADEMLAYVPEINERCAVDTLQLYNLDSTSISPAHWCGMAGCVEERYTGYDGFVVAHGTDTMAYTAAALSYLLQQSPKPVAVTGAQKPIGLRETDATGNLRDAFYYAADDGACGVHLVFDGRVILGTRARKTRTKSYNSFSSIDFPEVARIRDGRVVYFVSEKTEGMQPEFYRRMEPGVFVLKLIPGMRADIITALKPHYRALIIESFGVGGIPGTAGFAEAVEDWVRSGRVLVMSTQVPYEGVNLELYEVGYSMKKRLAMLETKDMTLEAAVTKLMWILGQTRDAEEIRKLFYTPVQRDMLL